MQRQRVELFVRCVWLLDETQHRRDHLFLIHACSSPWMCEPTATGEQRTREENQGAPFLRRHYPVQVLRVVALAAARRHLSLLTRLPWVVFVNYAWHAVGVTSQCQHGLEATRSRSDTEILQVVVVDVGLREG